MDEYTLVNKLLDTFPNITFQVTRRNTNLRIHFKADTVNYVPSKEYLCNALNIKPEQVKVAIKNYDDGIITGKGKLFTLINGIYI